jgi:hypothetical protein
MAKIQKMWFVECDYDEHAGSTRPFRRLSVVVQESMWTP